MKGLKVERRSLDRKIVDAIEVEGLADLTDLKPICSKGHIIDASTTGFLMLVHRTDLEQQEHKTNLDLSSLDGSDVGLFLPQMNLDLDGVIKRTRHTGQGFFEIFVEFASDIPEYWRECLMDLLPTPGELE